jgi:hypothetical protein
MLVGMNASPPNAPLTNTWMNNPQYLAQVGHFLGGGYVMTLATLAALIWAHGAGAPLGWTLGVGIAAAAIKEFYYDLRYELPKQTIADSAMDFTFYVVGGLVGAGIGAFALSRIALAPLAQ